MLAVARHDLGRNGGGHVCGQVVAHCVTGAGAHAEKELVQGAGAARQAQPAAEGIDVLVQALVIGRLAGQALQKVHRLHVGWLANDSHGDVWRVCHSRVCAVHDALCGGDVDIGPEGRDDVVLVAAINHALNKRGYSGPIAAGCKVAIEGSEQR